MRGGHLGCRSSPKPVDSKPSQIGCRMLLRCWPCRNHQHQHRTHVMRKQSTLLCLDPGCHVLRSKLLYMRRLHEVPVDVLVLVVLLFLSWRRREASPWRVWCPCIAQTSLGNCEGEKDAHLGGRCKGIACVRTKLSKSRSSSSSMFPPANGTGDNCVTSWNLPRNSVSKQKRKESLPFSAMSFDRWP